MFKNHLISTYTVLLGLTGAAAFYLLQLPLPFLFGPLAACLLGALLGTPLKGVSSVSKIGRVILGVAVGASITPAVMHQLPSMALSVALVPLYTLLITLIGVPYFYRIVKLDRATAYYAAMPGGLQDMVVFGIEAGADPKALSLIHATRVLIIVVSAPILVSHFFGVSLSNPIGVPASTIPVTELVLLSVAGLLGWKIAERLGLFGATILGPMLLTAALSLLDLTHARPPTEALFFAQLFIGIGIGVHYSGIRLKEVARLLVSAVVFVIILACLAAIFALVIAYFGLGGALEGFLAFAPGGQAEMTILAIIVGADLGFVVVHHLTRMILVILGAPLASRYLMPPRD